ncbi:hypothetical protein ACQPYK_21580 [Streptosporangium sp. CA-135522]|uniref:hypothetical protein n=1 Tax=Streptosporangium sp. CA-135522 TaxID=3240072 RepID=UPI003D8E876E
MDTAADQKEALVFDLDTDIEVALEAAGLIRRRADPREAAQTIFDLLERGWTAFAERSETSDSLRDHAP